MRTELLRLGRDAQAQPDPGFRRALRPLRAELAAQSVWGADPRARQPAHARVGRPARGRGGTRRRGGRPRRGWSWGQAAVGQLRWRRRLKRQVRTRCEPTARATSHLGLLVRTWSVVLDRGRPPRANVYGRGGGHDESSEDHRNDYYRTSARRATQKTTRLLSPGQPSQPMRRPVNELLTDSDATAFDPSFMRRSPDAIEFADSPPRSSVPSSGARLACTTELVPRTRRVTSSRLDL